MYSGLGQDALAYVGDREDINSIALSVVVSLLEKYDIPLNQIGRIEIGTESLIDKSKSTKTVLMDLFDVVGNVDVEGTTVYNACYGGTAALLNALAWADSSSWDGRYAIVVAADIAVYAPGPARPTCGCGAVAMLVGRDAPLQVDLLTRTAHATHQWDFFKPNPHSEYPVVNGKFSQKCYLTAFDSCYQRFLDKMIKFRQRPSSSRDIDFMLFHSPYNKLVQKTVQRLVYLDLRAGHLPAEPSVQKWLNVPLDETYTDRDLENALKPLADKLYRAKVASSCILSKQVGNTYTAAVYLNLANLVSDEGEALVGKRVTLFSYGSGAMASFFEIHPRQCSSAAHRNNFSLSRMQRVLSVAERLAARGAPCSPADFEAALATRERAHAKAPFEPTCPVESVARGHFYLSHVNEDYERHYLRRPFNDHHTAAAAKAFSPTPSVGAK
jgi:hydroxymethylglutaryl-CoA synthase